MRSKFLALMMLSMMFTTSEAFSRCTWLINDRNTFDCVDTEGTDRTAEIIQEASRGEDPRLLNAQADCRKNGGRVSLSRDAEGTYSTGCVL